MFIALHYITLHYTLHCIALHCFTLLYITLHYIHIHYIYWIALLVPLLRQTKSDKHPTVFVNWSNTATLKKGCKRMFLCQAVAMGSVFTYLPGYRLQPPTPKG